MSERGGKECSLRITGRICNDGCRIILLVNNLFPAMPRDIRCFFHAGGMQQEEIRIRIIFIKQPCSGRFILFQLIRID